MHVTPAGHMAKFIFVSVYSSSCITDLPWIRQRILLIFKELVGLFWNDMLYRGGVYRWHRCADWPRSHNATSSIA